MIARLNPEQKEDVSFVKTVATELFSDGITNWGRIASLLTFGAMVCKHQNDGGLGKCVSLVGEEISSYLLTDQRDWLLKNKAWVSYFFISPLQYCIYSYFEFSIVCNLYSPCVCIFFSLGWLCGIFSCPGCRGSCEKHIDGPW